MLSSGGRGSRRVAVFSVPWCRQYESRWSARGPVCIALEPRLLSIRVCRSYRLQRAAWYPFVSGKRDSYVPTLPREASCQRCSVKLVLTWQDRRRSGEGTGRKQTSPPQDLLWCMKLLFAFPVTLVSLSYEKTESLFSQGSGC
ncbi:uncharacterized protein RG961_016133 isoform 1-T4 [Leptosomus discolor]